MGNSSSLKGEGMILAPEKFYILIEEDGPYLVFGEPPINQQIIAMNHRGDAWYFKTGRAYNSEAPTALCRCGQSQQKPYCDGTHKHVDWDSTLTAPLKFDLKQARIYEGPHVIVSDNEEYCAYARFCDAGGQIWNLVGRTENDNDVGLVCREAAHCPSGRLIAWDKKTGNPIEPHFTPSIGIIQDPALKISGPLWVRGGIRIVRENGKQYDVRNRVTLCRCGRSENKPFCNGAHASCSFHDGQPSKFEDGGEIF